LVRRACALAHQQIFIVHDSVSKECARSEGELNQQVIVDKRQYVHQLWCGCLMIGAVIEKMPRRAMSQNVIHRTEKKSSIKWGLYILL
jgi:hypothetical protein